MIASWMVYHYLAPKSWREWASAGLVQAFLIALYAKMYGFPLTIYLLARFFGLDRTDLNASLWSTLLGVGELGMVISMAGLGRVREPDAAGQTLASEIEVDKPAANSLGWQSWRLTHVVQRTDHAQAHCYCLHERFSMIEFTPDCIQSLCLPR